jgi:hypothetical protein
VWHVIEFAKIEKKVLVQAVKQSNIIGAAFWTTPEDIIFTELITRVLNLTEDDTRRFSSYHCEEKSALGTIPGD